MQTPQHPPILYCDWLMCLWCSDVESGLHSVSALWSFVAGDHVHRKSLPNQLQNSYLSGKKSSTECTLICLLLTHSYILGRLKIPLLPLKTMNSLGLWAKKYKCFPMFAYSIWITSLVMLSVILHSSLHSLPEFKDNLLALVFVQEIFLPK